MAQVADSSFGSSRRSRSLPEPGRRLVETYPADRMVTSFVVDPRPGKTACDVTISTVFPKRWGPIGWLERRIVRGLLNRVYAEELHLLAAYLHPDT